MSDKFVYETTGAILAGGKSRRMEGIEKGLCKFKNRTLVENIIYKIEPQTSTLIINANNHVSEYEKYGYPVIKDNESGHPGPLAGIAACLKVAKTEFILCVPCDSPLLPDDLCQRLYQTLIEEDADITYAHDGQRRQPLFALINTKLIDSVTDFLGSGNHKVDAWYHQQNQAECDFSDQSEKFLNINSEQDLQKAINIQIE